MLGLNGLTKVPPGRATQGLCFVSRKATGLQVMYHIADELCPLHWFLFVSENGWQYADIKSK